MAATKDGAWEQRGPICYTESKHPVSVGLYTATEGGDEPSPASRQYGWAPHFLAMMVRAPRAVDLLRK